jgi:aspartate/methionine/tyrosine aminotransferase
VQIAKRVTFFGESVIRRMTRLAMAHGAINLSQGYPDFDPAPELVEAAVAALRGGHHQYSPTWGIAPLRETLAELYSARLGWNVDPAVHVTVACGVTEAMNAVMMGLLNPGDEIVIVEPAHENYVPSAILCGAKAVGVPLEEPGYRLNAARLAAAVNQRTKAVVLNTPHNPTGRVFDEDEMAGLIEVVVENDLALITDEIYDHILYDGRRHVYPGGIKAIQDRTVTVSGLSKTYAITGWRLGYVVAPTALSAAIRPVHDFLTVCAPTPLQVAAVTALNLPQSYYDQMTADYHERRATIVDILQELGFRTPTPEGAYYVLADYSGVPIPQAKWDSTSFAEWMTVEIGVAVVPGTVFYSAPGHGDHSVRFAFPKKLATLRAARERMSRMLTNV